jgi:hypothetical protein
MKTLRKRDILITMIVTLYAVLLVIGLVACGKKTEADKVEVKQYRQFDTTLSADYVYEKYNNRTSLVNEDGIRVFPFSSEISFKDTKEINKAVARLYISDLVEKYNSKELKEKGDITLKVNDETYTGTELTYKDNNISFVIIGNRVYGVVTLGTEEVTDIVSKINFKDRTNKEDLK